MTPLSALDEARTPVVFLAGAFTWLCACDRVSDRVRAAVLVATAFAAIGGTFLAINFHLGGGGVPRPNAREGVTDRRSVTSGSNFKRRKRCQIISIPSAGCR